MLDAMAARSPRLRRPAPHIRYQSTPTLAWLFLLLLAARSHLNKASPSTNSKGYKAAQDALKKYEDMTYSDAEIDAFLPKELKRGKPS
jgi:hypothetical protein